jgi:hypothetical protein
LFLAPAEVLRIAGLPGEAGAIWLALAGLFLAGLAATRVLGLLARPVLVGNLAISLGVQALLVIYLLLKLADLNHALVVWVLVGGETVVGLVGIWYLARLQGIANAR